MTGDTTGGVLGAAGGSIISTKDVPSTAWRNGAGTTREIAALRAPGSPTDFEWRISVADLTRDASFSRFPGIDRTFLVASGAGVVLAVAGTAVSLGRGGSATFSGEDEVTVTLPRGPATAVNLMTRGSYRGVMTAVPIDGERYLASGTVAVLLLEGSARTSEGGILRPLDFFLCGTGTQALHFTDAVAVVIDVSHR